VGGSPVASDRPGAWKGTDALPIDWSPEVMTPLPEERPPSVAERIGRLLGQCRDETAVAARGLTRARWFSLLALLTLALGMPPRACMRGIWARRSTGRPLPTGQGIA
jgi:hypothetical protein